MERSPKRKTTFFEPGVNAIFPGFYGVSFEIISFSITAMGEGKFIPVNGANDISDGIDVAIGKNPGGMRAFIGKGVQLITMLTDAYRFPVAFCNSDIVFSKLEGRDIMGNPEPL